VPPIYSARKVGGKRSYELARKGIEVNLPANPVVIKEMKLLSWEPPELSLSILCSTGTYIRALARDIGRDLGTGGHVSTLERNSVGSLTVDEAIPLEKAIERAESEGLGRMLLPIELPLRNWSKVRIDNSSRFKLVNGAKVIVGDSYIDNVGEIPADYPCRVGIWETNGAFLGIGRIEPAGTRSYILYPEKVITSGAVAG
jgi:tRNA pseudouridine55 synthase